MCLTNAGEKVSITIILFVGGLRAVIFTDTLQTFILVIGAAIVTIICKYTVKSVIRGHSKDKKIGFQDK